MEFNKLNRFKVLKVSTSDKVKILELEHLSSAATYECQLSGTWYKSFVFQDDIVHLRSSLFYRNILLVNDDHGLMVIEPDKLISVRSVAKSLTCMRQAWLNEIFGEKRNFERIVSSVAGIVVHDIFLTACTERLRKVNQLKELSDKSFEKEHIKTRCSDANLAASELGEKVAEFFPRISTSIENYFLDEPKLLNDEQIRIQVNTVYESEKSINCPSLGLRGTVDAICEVTIYERSSTREVVVPFELKTGYASSYYYTESKYQTMLYSMMMKEEGYDQCDAGLLLYLKTNRKNHTPKMIWTQVKRANEIELIQRRNDLVYYLSLDKSGLKGSGFGGNRISKERIRNSGHENDQLFIWCLIAGAFEEEKIRRSSFDLKRFIGSELSHLSSDEIKFFKKWMRLVVIESEEKEKKTDSLFWTESSFSREEKNLGFGNLVISQVDQKKIVFKRAYSPSLQNPFNEGLLCKKIAISVDEPCGMVPTKVASFVGIVSRVTEETIEVDVKSKVERFDYSTPYRVDLMISPKKSFELCQNLVTLMTNVKTSDKLRDIIIRQQINGAKRVLESLGTRNLTEVERSTIHHLNPAQKRAVLQIVDGPEDHLLIRGISGSGRTTIIIAVVKILLQRGKSILISSHSGHVLRNIKIQLKKADKDFILGSPHEHSFSEKGKVTSYTGIKNQKKTSNWLKVGDVLCLGVSIGTHEGERFDLCIVNDASQIVLPAILGPLLKSDRFVLIGDENQLPLVIQSDKARAGGLEENLFTMLLRTNQPISLKQQYKKNEEILVYPNKLFYKKALRCGSDEVAKSAIPKANGPTDIPWLDCVLSNDLDQAFLFLDTDHSQTELTDEINPHYESDLCAQIVNAFKDKSDISTSNIGIICPLPYQVSLLRERISDKNVLINTIDKFQGKERMIILFPVMGMDGPFISSLDLILSNSRYLNVALTRATKKFILIGNKKSLIKYKLTFSCLFDLMGEKKFPQI